MNQESIFSDEIDFDFFGKTQLSNPQNQPFQYQKNQNIFRDDPSTNTYGLVDLKEYFSCYSLQPQYQQQQIFLPKQNSFEQEIFQEEQNGAEQNPQIQMEKKQKEEKNIPATRKTKKITKKAKRKNKKMQKNYNEQSYQSSQLISQKRKYKPRGTNDNNEPKIFGAVVKNVLIKDLNLKLDDSYRHQGRYYLHSAYSLAQGNNCAQQFLINLDQRLKQRILRGQKKGQDLKYLNNYINSVQILKDYYSTENVTALRNSFKVIYNHKIDDSDDIDSYRKTTKEGYEKVEQIRQIYHLQPFFN